MKNVHLPALNTVLFYLRHYLRTSSLGVAFSSVRRRKRLKNKHQDKCQQLEKLGYIIVENYLTPDECRDARDKLKWGFEHYPDFIHHTEDKRIFGVENWLPAATRLAKQTEFLELGELVNREVTYCAFTLGGWLTSAEGGSSGNGWHRDAFLSQFKAMVYLTDVTEENGPFEILPGSHKLSNVLNGINNADIGFMQDRLWEEDVIRLERSTNIKRKAIVGSAGTLVLFNAATVHRGRPIQSGERLALTNYYFPASRDIELVRKQFSPVMSQGDVHNLL